MTFEDMLAYAPVYIYQRSGTYHCNWSPELPTGARVHGRGAADSPYRAAVNAFASAQRQGWKKAE